MSYTIKPKVMAKLAAVLHRQNPKVLTIETARRDIEEAIADVIKQGKASDDGFFSRSTAGYQVTYTDDGSCAEVEVAVLLLSVYVDGDEDGPAGYKWPALKNFGS